MARKKKLPKAQYGPVRKHIKGLDTPIDPNTGEFPEDYYTNPDLMKTKYTGPFAGIKKFLTGKLGPKYWFQGETRQDVTPGRAKRLHKRGDVTSTWTGGDEYTHIIDRYGDRIFDDPDRVGGYTGPLDEGGDISPGKFLRRGGKTGKKLL